MRTSLTGLPLCPTCGRLASSHTNPIAHAFGDPYRMVVDRRARSGAVRTDFGRHFRLGSFIRGAAVARFQGNVDRQAEERARRRLDAEDGERIEPGFRWGQGR